MLPAALWAESDAVMVNSERNLTLLAQSIPPAGQARPDWELICEVAEHMGFGADFDYKSSEQIFDEIRGFSNLRTGYDLRGASYDRLRETPLQWPVAPATARPTATRSAISTTASARTSTSTRPAARRDWRFPPRRGGRSFTRARTWTPTSFPTTTSRSC